MTSLEKAVDLAGGQVALAKAIREWFEARGIICRVKQAHVWGWLNKQGKVPGEYVIAIADILKWQITPNALRPDLYPHPHDGLPEHMRAAA